MLDITPNLKNRASRLAERFTSSLILLTWFGYLTSSFFVGHARACLASSQVSSRWTGTLGVYKRRALFKRILTHVGEDVYISYGSIITKPSAELGDRVYIGSYCMLGDVRIGAETQIADLVMIPSGAAQHGIGRLDTPVMDQPGEYKTIHIGVDCWIGSSATILADIGNHCIVGAGSVVTKPVEDYQIVAGNPARPIGDRREIKVNRDV